MKINVQHIAKLANLPLTQEEELLFEKQLAAVLEHIEHLTEVDTQDVTETSQVTGLIDVERVDETLPSLTQETATNQARETHNGLFIVPVILEEAIEA